MVLVLPTFQSIIFPRRFHAIAEAWNDSHMDKDPENSWLRSKCGHWESLAKIVSVCRRLSKMIWFHVNSLLRLNKRSVSAKRAMLFIGTICVRASKILRNRIADNVIGFSNNLIIVRSIGFSSIFSQHFFFFFIRSHLAAHKSNANECMCENPTLSPEVFDRTWK